VALWRPFVPEDGRVRVPLRRRHQDDSPAFAFAPALL